jgi:hypothetical protein
MIQETNSIEQIIDRINTHLNNDEITESELEELGQLAFLLYNEYCFRPIFPDLSINSTIGRKYHPGNEFQREEITPEFFKNTNRIKYLIEYIKIKPLLLIMENDYFDLPKDYTGNFPQFIQSLYNQYIDDLNKLPNHDIFTTKNLDEVRKLCNSIIEAINHYYNGFPSVAYQTVEQGMRVVTEHAQEFYSKAHRNPYVFRMRVGSNHTFSRKEMFHIPFEKRGIVSSQRYSIPGLPCLYLGSSVYVCWEEMNKPDLNTTQTSMFVFKPDKEIHLLDLGYPPKAIRESIEEFMCQDYGTERWSSFIKSLVGYLVIWPLIAAVSIRVKNRDDTFKPEYIVPQLLLQWIRLSQNYDGIRYFSVASKSLNRENFHLLLNYAFPVKTSNSEGHCERLKEYFWLTDAVPWQLFQIYKDSGQEVDKRGFQIGTFEPIIGTKINYDLTDFAKLESFLRKQRPKSLD